MWTTFLGKHICPQQLEIVLALIPSRICYYQFCNRLDSLTLCNTRTVTFKLVAVKRGARDLLSCIKLCQLFVTLQSLFVVHLFVINRSFILFVVRLFILFPFSQNLCLFYCCSKEKRTILILNHVQVFRSCYYFKYPLYKNKYLFSTSSRVNKHHTADSTDFVLVQEAKEPITDPDQFP